MTDEILAWLRTAKERWAPNPTAILEIGSCNVNGTPRSAWNDCPCYVGIDRVPGPGVDIVAPTSELWPDQLFPLVICCEALEHDPRPIDTVIALRQHVAPGGLLIITTPANGFPDHKYPKDYWRFLDDAYAEIFFIGMYVLEIATVGGPTGTICGAARVWANFGDRWAEVGRQVKEATDGN